MGNVNSVVVVSATRPSVQVTIVDRNGSPVNLTGATQAPRLQGKSSVVPAVTIDYVGTIIDALGGKVEFTQLGTLVSHSNLSAVGVTSAVFTCRAKWWDSAGKFDYSEPLYYQFEDTPI